MAHVLLVDDDNFFRSSLGDAISRAGHRVTRAATSLEAINQLHLAYPAVDIVVADVVMPGMDGWGLLNSVKGNKKFQHIPVILVSGETLGVPMSRGPMSYSPDECMAKPVQVEDLLGLIAKYTQAKGSATP